MKRSALRVREKQKESEIIMRTDTKNKLIYILLNAVFAVPLLLMSILGMTLINYVLYAIGALIVLIGVISFFPSIVVKTGIFDEFGNEYVETNLFERLATLGITVLVGGAVAMLPSFLNMPSFFGYIAITALAVGLGVKITAENSKYYLSGSTVILGQFLPLAYIIGGAAFLLEAAFSIGIWFRILVMSIAFLLHILRAVLVFRESAFY